MVPSSRLVSPEEYLAFERVAETKSEYCDGVVFPRPGATLAHSQLQVRIAIALMHHTDRRPCAITDSNLRIQIFPDGPFVYPDLAITCGQPLLRDKEQDVLLNPTVIFEVLSKSSEAYDRGQKFAQYRRIDSLRDYVLVSQDEPRIEVFSRENDGKWTLSEAVGLTSLCVIPSIGCQLNLADVYRNISFQPEESPAA